MSLFGVPGDDGLNPVVRIVINNIVSKRFGLTKAEVSGLTIEEKARLMKSTFSEAEIKRLLEEEVNSFFAPFKSLLQLARTDATVNFYFNLIFFPVAGFPSFQHHANAAAQWLLNKVFPSSQHARLTNNAAQERHERCFCFSKSKYSRSPKLKEVEQHQEGTSGAVVPSSRSTG